jgi:hypothetical protein
MKASEYIRAGRDEIAKGWCKYKGMDGNGNVCAYGALARVTERIPMDVRIAMKPNGRIAEDYLTALVVEIGFDGVISMNDDPSTTQQDMLNLFEKTAIGLEERGL